MKNQNEKNNSNNQADCQVEGRNSVIELLKSGKDINKLFVQKGEKHGSIIEIINLAKKIKSFSRK